jgi:hypothetical protein
VSSQPDHSSVSGSTRGDRQALLEAIAFGEDPKITPSDRLRALELLEVDESAARPLEADASDMDDAALREFADEYIGSEIVTALRVRATPDGATVPGPVKLGSQDPPLLPAVSPSEREAAERAEAMFPRTIAAILKLCPVESMRPPVRYGAGATPALHGDAEAPDA